jgi:hypothetical protein
MRRIWALLKVIIALAIAIPVAMVLFATTLACLASWSGLPLGGSAPAGIDLCAAGLLSRSREPGLVRRRCQNQTPAGLSAGESGPYLACKAEDYRVFH